MNSPSETTKEVTAALVAVEFEALPDGVLVVCEVKCRKGRGFGDPLEAITYAKVRTLRHLAAIFARQSGVSARRLRVDAVGILWRPGEEPELVHARGIEE